MKLKEAQLLGILALIAVGIILLCMWGSGRGKDAEVAVQPPQTQDPALEPDLAELYADLLGSGTPPAPTDMANTRAVNMNIGGVRPSKPPVSESAAINRVIEERAPRDIGLTPAAQTPGVASTAPAVAPEAPRTFTHVVAGGETLSAISQKYYGTTNKWRIILDANSSVLKDPRQLRPNMKLTIPASASETAQVNAGQSSAPTVLAAIQPGSPAAARTHTVASGDALYRIAQKYYGDGNRYKDILAANRSVISEPRDLRPGMKIVIP